MKHVVIGYGNLGYCLTREISKTKTDAVYVLSSHTGWSYPTSIQKILDCKPDHVWVTVGAGSVEQGNLDYTPFSDLHIRLPMELAQKLNPEATLHLFSTDYVHDPFKSLYALSKSHMEQAITILGRDNTYVYRIGSLYGTYKPEKCFPYKLKKNSLIKEIKLPLNLICPTPTDWLAEKLIDMLDCYENLKDTLIVSPRGYTTVQTWGELILDRKVEDCGFDTNRPEKNDFSPEYTFNPSWLDLWEARKDVWKGILNKLTP